MTKPYNKQQPKGEQVEEMFNNIAPTYDSLNHTLSFNIDKLWRAKMVGMVAKLNPKKVIDLATGTGDVAITIAKRLPEAKIHGIDLSPGMLEVARTKIAKLGLTPQISLSQGRAEELGVAPASADVVTVAFGVRNFEDLELGLRQIAQSLRTGGEVVILEFSTPTKWGIAPLYRFYSHRVLPWIGGLISKDRKAYDYLPNSVDTFPTPERFGKMLEEAGFTNVRIKSLSFGVAQIYRATAK